MGMCDRLIIGDEKAASQTLKLKWMMSKQQAITQADLLAMTDELHQQINAFRATQ
jgi:histidyl-tRNA synthetase